MKRGRMVETVWTEIPVFYPGIVIDVFQIMPNHFRGIIIITVGATSCGCPLSPIKTPESPKTNDYPEIGQKWNFGMMGDNVDVDVNQGQARGPARTAQIAQLSLPDVVHRFKTMTTKRYADGVKYQGWPPFSGKLWQRNYYERIIRNQNEFDRIRHYIVNNPINWVRDIEHPVNPGATTQFPDDICKEV